MTQIVQLWRQLCDDVKQENKNRDASGNPNKIMTQNTTIITSNLDVTQKDKNRR